MSEIPKHWIDNLQEMGLKPSIHDCYANTPIADIPCESLPGIRGSFYLVGEGNEGKLEPGVYLTVGILPIGISRYPKIRDAIAMFIVQALSDRNNHQVKDGLNQGVEFDIVGQTSTESTILRLRPANPEQYKRLGQMVESGEYAMRVNPFPSS